jgi:hypothetical protein
MKRLRKKIPKKMIIIDRRPKQIRDAILGLLLVLGVVFLVWTAWNKGYFRKDKKEITNTREMNAGKSYSLLKETEASRYYKFGSVNVTLSNGLNQIAAGSSALVNAEVKNNNRYPITDGNLYVRLFKKHPKKNSETVDYFKTSFSEKILGDTDDLVDQWNAIEDINLKPNENKKLSFSYQLSPYLPEGEYYIASYFQVAKKFNLSGLPFTEDIMGGKLNFSLENPQVKETIGFQKDGVKVNSEPYNFVGFTKSYPADQEVTLNAPLKNATEKKQIVPVDWSVYYWDNQIEKNRVDRFREEVIVNAGETKDLQYKVKPNDYPVNYVAVEINKDNNNAKSILAIRFGRESRETARINFQGLSNFPLESDKESILFLNAHGVKELDSLSSPTKENVEQASSQGEKKSESHQYEISAILKDRNQNVIHQTKYTGPITGEVMGFEEKFLPDQKYEYVTLATQIKNDQGKVVDETTTTYDCQKIDSNQCPTGISAAVSDIKSRGKNIFTGIAIIIALILIFAVVAFLVFRYRKNMTKIILIIVLPAVLSVSILIVGASEAKAKETVFIEPSVDVAMFKGALYEPHVDNGWIYNWASVQNILGSIKYSTEVNDGAGASLDGAISLTPGSIFYVEDATHADEHAITWSLTGNFADTPDGYWESGVDSSSINSYSPQANDLVKTWSLTLPIYGGVNGLSTYNYYFPQIFNPPVISLSASGPVDCVQQNEYRWRCTVRNEDGQINLSMNYAPTYGYHFFYTDYARDGVINNIQKGIMQKRLFCDGSFFVGKPGYNQCWKYNVPGNLIIDGAQCNPCDDLRVEVPDQSIDYAFDVTATGSAPTEPSCLNCPSSLSRGAVGSFNIGGSTDSDGDKLKYVVDWIGLDGIPESESPLDVSDGTYFFNFSKSWANMETVNFQFKAIDETGRSSGWVPGSVQIVEPTCQIEFNPPSSIPPFKTMSENSSDSSTVLKLTSDSDAGCVCGNIDITQESGIGGVVSLAPNPVGVLSRNMTISTGSIATLSENFKFLAQSTTDPGFSNCGSAELNLTVTKVCNVSVTPSETDVYPGQTVLLDFSTDFPDPSGFMSWSIASGSDYVDSTSEIRDPVTLALVGLRIKLKKDTAQKVLVVHVSNGCGSTDATIYVQRPGWIEVN